MPFNGLHGQPQDEFGGRAALHHKHERFQRHGGDQAAGERSPVIGE